MQVSRRWGSWWSWVTQPWRTPGVVVALIGSLALPALLLSAGPMFRASASDSIAVQIVGDLERGPAGLSIAAVGPLDADPYDELSAALVARLDGIDELGPVARTLISDERRVDAVNGLPSDDERADIRLLARPGALDAVDVVAGRATPDGVVIPAAMAERRDLEPGDVISFGVDDVVVTGIYRDLWDGDADEYWQELPRDFVPRFVRAFNEADFQLVVLDERLLLELGPLGRARFDAALDATPATWDRLQRVTGQYRQLEADLTRETDLGGAYRRFADDPEQPPSIFTALYGARDDASALIARLQQPVRTATIGGAVAGVLLSTLGAIFLVRRRRSDFRLMAADGDAAWRFFARALAQYAGPAAVGMAVGAAAAWVTITALGPTGTARVSVIPWSDVIAVTALACALAGVVTGAIAIRLTDSMEQQVGAIGRTWLFLLVGAVAAMWIQVGRTDQGADQGGVNPLVVAFPLVGILTGVTVIVATLRWVLRSVRRSGSRLPTSLFLAWRALTASEAGALLLTAAIGLATGLAVLSATFVDTIDTATTAKAVTLVGSDSRLDTRDNVDVTTLPAESTVLLVQTTRIGQRAVDVVAVDPATFAGAVAWPSQFGGSAQRLIDDLDAEPAGAIAAVLVDGEPLPTDGEFGLQRRFPYRIVGTVASAPLASPEHATLIVRADKFEEFARDRWVSGDEAIDPVDQQVADTLGREIDYVSPLDAFADTVVSRQPLDVLVGFGNDQGWRVADTNTFDQQVNSVSAQSTRWAFDYLGILAVIAGVVALAVMTFYLAERRSQRNVAAVMTAQMGVSQRTNVMAAIAEMVGLTVVAIAAGVAAATTTARRVFPVFEPDPDIPPTIDLVVSSITIATLLAVAIGSVSIIAGLAQRSASSAEKAQVLRG